MAIGGYFRLNYHRLLTIIGGYFIDDYFIGGYFIDGYWLVINGYYINDYWWLFY